MVSMVTVGVASCVPGDNPKPLPLVTWDNTSLLAATLGMPIRNNSQSSTEENASIQLPSRSAESEKKTKSSVNVMDQIQLRSFRYQLAPKLAERVDQLTANRVDKLPPCSAGARLGPGSSSAAWLQHGSSMAPLER